MKTLRDAGCKQEIIARLQNIGRDTPRRWGRMNASQMICHASDAFLGVMGDKKMEPTKGINFWPLMKGFVLYAPFTWPKGVPTRPEFDQFAGGTPPSESRPMCGCCWRRSTSLPSSRVRFSSVLIPCSRR
jgi:hypothetical protein